MQTKFYNLFRNALIFSLIVILHDATQAQNKINCAFCHGTQNKLWSSSRHAQTQFDVATELAKNWIGQAPDSVINGSSAEDCVACHGPTAVSTGSGMSEVQVMSHYFTTTAGLYTAV